MTYDTDTLRNQLLACKQRSIELDQARIDAEMSRRAAVLAERVAVDRLRAVESEAAEHKCPPDVRGRVRELETEVKGLRARRIPADQTGRVRELTADVKALQTQAASLRVALGRSEGTATRLTKELEKQRKAVKVTVKTEPVNERLLMRVRQLEAESKLVDTKPQVDARAAAVDLAKAQQAHAKTMSAAATGHAAEIKSVTESNRKAMGKERAEHIAKIKRAESDLAEQTAKTKAAQREVKRLTDALAEKPKTVTFRDKPEPVNERLLMRIKQLEAEHGRN